MQHCKILALTGLLILGGCAAMPENTTVVVAAGNTPGPNPPPAVNNGPPAHAPAHGYRRQQRDGVDMEFSNELGVYVVINVRDTYFHDNFYLRYFDGRWMIAVRLDGPWGDAQDRQVPDKLKKSRPPGNGHGNGNGKSKDKDKPNQN